MPVEVVEITLDADLAVGSVIGAKYRVTSRARSVGAELRCGALHEGTGRAVELRVLVAADDGARERMTRAARAAGSAPHAHVLGVLDSGVDAQGRMYVVYEHSEGESASELVARTGPLAVHEAAELTHQLARALSSLHQRGIKHRAIRPESVRVGAGPSGLCAKLSGFELAVVPPRFASPPPLARGFSRYAAPEARRDAYAASEATDIFALGVLFRFLATGSDAQSSALGGHAERIVARATADDPEARFASADQLVAALSLLLPSDMRAGSVLPTDPLLADVRYLHKLAEQRESQSSRDDAVLGVTRTAALVMIEAVYARVGRAGWHTLVTEQPELDALLPRAGAPSSGEARVSSALIERFLLGADRLLRADGVPLGSLPAIGTNIAQRGLRRIFPAYPAQLSVDAWLDSLPALYGALYTDGVAEVDERTRHTARLVVRGHARASLALSALFAGLVRAELVRLAPFASLRMVASAELGEQRDVFELSLP